MSTTYAAQASADIVKEARRITNMLDPRDRGPALALASVALKRMAEGDPSAKSPSGFMRCVQILREVETP